MKENRILIKRILKNYNRNMEIIERHMLESYGVYEEGEDYFKIEESYFKRASREVELRNLLFLQLNEDEKMFLHLKYVKKMKVPQMLEVLYLSNSEYYRKQNIILSKLENYIDEFKELFIIK